MEKLRPGDPEHIGPYEVIARLGAGGMGVVFLGTKGANRVAIKVVRSTFLDDPSLKTRFVREIETLRKVQSPYVAKFLDSSVDGEIAWHAVEFVNGPTLKELIDSNGPMAEADWLTFAGQLRQALHSVHRLDIVHRDIKPANIIMSETGPKLIDFGISQDSEATNITTTGAVAGSPAWLAPEQLTGEQLSPASDLFSAGAVLLYAATGRSPWGQHTTMSVPVVYQKILSGDVDFSGITPNQQKLVARLLERDPGARGFDESQTAAGSVQTPTKPVAKKEELQNQDEITETAPAGSVEPPKSFPQTHRSAPARSKRVKSGSSPSKVEGTPPPAKSHQPNLWVRSRGVGALIMAGGAIAILAVILSMSFSNQETTTQNDSATPELDATSPNGAEAKSVPEILAQPAVECETFLCAFAVGFEESDDGVTVWVWSRDSSVYTVYDISLEVTGGPWGGEPSRLGNCDGPVSLLPAGNWVSGNDGGTTWTRLCRNASLAEGRFANLTVSRGREEWVKLTLKPELAAEQPRSDWGAEWYQLDRIGGFEASDTASPDPNEVFRNDTFSMTFAGGLDYGLGPQGLFDRYYTVSADDTRIVRQDCSENAQPERHPVQAKNPLEHSWITVGNATFTSGCEEGASRTYEISVDTIQSNFPGLDSVDFRFLNPHPLEATNPTTQWEAWNVHFN